MKKKQLCVILSLGLILSLSACGTAQQSTLEPTDTPLPVFTPEPTPDTIPEPTPEQIKEPPEYIYFERDYGEISWPPMYETVFPCVNGYEKPEFDFGRTVNGCELLLLPTNNEHVSVCTLQKDECVEVLAKTVYTYDQYQFADQSWYMVGTESGQWGWLKAEELEQCDAPESFNGLRYEYTQGIVIDGCELSQLPGEKAIWLLARNSYVEILASATAADGETWLYVHFYTASAEFHECLWVRACEIKQYTSENMYDILDFVKVSPGSKCYWENGTEADIDTDGEYILQGYEENTVYWLAGPSLVFYVESFEDLIYPEPLE